MGCLQPTINRYKRIVAGEDPDLELKSGDVVVVKEPFS
jgi:hypothetical protein